MSLFTDVRDLATGAGLGLPGVGVSSSGLSFRVGGVVGQDIVGDFVPGATYFDQQAAALKARLAQLATVAVVAAPIEFAPGVSTVATRNAIVGNPLDQNLKAGAAVDLAVAAVGGTVALGAGAAANLGAQQAAPELLAGPGAELAPVASTAVEAGTVSAATGGGFLAELKGALATAAAGKTLLGLATARPKAPIATQPPGAAVAPRPPCATCSSTNSLAKALAAIAPLALVAFT